MNEHTHDVDEANAGPLEAALQDGDKQDQGSSTGSRTQDSPAGEDPIGPGETGTTGRGSFTTPGAVASVHDVASKAETFSDPVAGEEASGAEILEEAKHRM